MGITAEFENKEFQDILNLIKQKCDKMKIAYGEHIVDPSKQILQNKLFNGQKFIALGLDGVFLHRYASLKNYIS